MTDTAPRPTRVLDALLGGSDNRTEDRAAASRLTAIFPDPRTVARLAATRYQFQSKAVTWMAGHLGVSQFVACAAGRLTAGHAVHRVARAVTPTARVAYIADDEETGRRIGQFVTAGQDGLAVAVAGARNPGAILADEAVRAVINPAEPLGVLLGPAVAFMTGEEVAAAVKGFAGLLAPGSGIALCCLHVEDEATAGRIAAVWDGRWVNHSPEDVAGWFAGAGLRPAHDGIGDVEFWPALRVPAGDAVMAGGVGIKD